MKNIFYSPSEKIVYWIAGYCRDSNTDNLIEKIDSLKTDGQILADFLGVELSVIGTYIVKNSRRFKHMRVFYAQGITQPPAIAYEISCKMAEHVNK